MEIQKDPYSRLRPHQATAEVEICHCSILEGIILRDSFSDNPLYCIKCNGEVEPSRIGFDEKLAEEIARWLNVYHSLYMLWLDSGEYEQWSCQRLSDIHGSVHKDGRDVVNQLSEYKPAYYFWFVDTENMMPEDIVVCPFCSNQLTPYQNRMKGRICEPCKIIV